MTYYTRSIIFILFISGILLTGGCRKKSHNSNESHLSYADTALVDVVLVLQCNDMEDRIATKMNEADEKAIKTLNLFFVHKKYKPDGVNPEIRHYYFDFRIGQVDEGKITNGQVKLTNIRLGKYRVYAIANAKSICTTNHTPLIHGLDYGKLCCFDHALTSPDGLGGDLCQIKEVDIQNLVSDHYRDIVTPSSGLLMSSFGVEKDPSGNPLVDVDGNPQMWEDIDVIQAGQAGMPSDNANIKSTVTVHLMRRVARYEFSYSYFGLLDQSVPGNSGNKLDDIEISAMYLPKKMPLFGRNNNIDSDPDYYDLNGINIAADPLDAYNETKPEYNPNSPSSYNSVLFYVPENMQGEDVRKENGEPLTSQDRNGKYAPTHSSYIFMTGKYSGKMGEKTAENSPYNVSIYLGDEGNKSEDGNNVMTGGNFNVMGNGNYRIHLDIGGPNLDDIRTSWLTFNVVDEFKDITTSTVSTAIIDIIYSNFFNDIFKLDCVAIPGVDATKCFFSIYKLKPDTYDVIQTIAEDKPGTALNILVEETDGEKIGPQTLRLKIEYEQKLDAKEVYLILKLQTRYGFSTLTTTYIDVDPW